MNAADDDGGPSATFSFSSLEPAVNRYSAGGAFEAHQDEYGLTVNILLSEPGAFTGGGTGFYTQHEDGRREAAPSIRIEPEQGVGSPTPNPHPHPLPLNGFTLYSSNIEP